jgi:hypothetical protein
MVTQRKKSIGMHPPTHWPVSLYPDQPPNVSRIECVINCWPPHCRHLHMVTWKIASSVSIVPNSAILLSSLPTLSCHLQVNHQAVTSMDAVGKNDTSLPSEHTMHFQTQKILCLLTFLASCCLSVSWSALECSVLCAVSSSQGRLLIITS